MNNARKWKMVDMDSRFEWIYLRIQLKLVYNEQNCEIQEKWCKLKIGYIDIELRMNVKLI